MNDHQRSNDANDVAELFRPADDLRQQIDGADSILFRQFAEALPSLCWMAAPNGEVFWANSNWHTYTGGTPQDGEATEWRNLFHPEELAAVLGEWAEAVATGQVFDRVLSMKGADGLYKPFLTRAAPMMDSHNKIIAWSGINIEIVELHRQQSLADQARRNLADELDDLKRLFAQAPSFMAMLRGPDHRFVLANSAYMQLIGHRDILGKTVAEALPDAAKQGYVDLLDKVYRSGEAYSSAGAKYAVQVVPDGPIDERFVDFVYQPVSGPTGEVVGIFVEGYDVTERIEAGAQLEVTLAEKNRLAEHNELIAREMSHRVMNSFQLMEGMFRVQTGRITDPAAKAAVEQAGQRLHAMALVHRHLFRITRDDITQLNVSDYLHELLGEVGPAFITDNQCTLTLNVADDIHLSSAQGVALGLFVTELIINACKHAFRAGDNGQIIVELTKEENSQYKLVVSDNGIGLPPDHDATSSSGLGMKLLSSFVRQLKGQLTVSGPPGTSFQVIFPLPEELEQ